MSDENSANVDREEFADRLIDRGLREVVGGEKPPELSNRILAAAGATASVGSADEATPASETTAQAAVLNQSPRFGWVAFALAACLLIGAAPLLFPSIQAARESARRAEPAAGGKDRGLANNQISFHDIDAKPVTGPHENDEAANADFDSLMDTIASTVEAEPVTEGQGEQGNGQQPAFESNMSLAIAGGAQQQGQQGEGQQSGQASTDYFHDAEAATRNYDFAELSESRDNLNSFGSRPRSAAIRSGDRAGQGDGAASREQQFIAQGSSRARSTNGIQPGDGELNTNLGTLVLSDGHSLASNGPAPAQNEPAVRYSRESLAEASVEAEAAERLATSGTKLREYTAELDLFSLGFERGTGPGAGGDQYAPIVENAFLAINPATTDNRLSTFSIDVDTASYANVRQFLMESNMLPPPDAVRIEELVNYFDYNYSAPTGDVPFDANVDVAACPWKPEHRLVRVGIKGREMERDRRPKSNLVFLVDVSGSMDEPNKLPLVLEGLRMLTRELGENDRIAIVVYASTEGLVLESTRGDQQQTILDALNRLSAGGSTAGGAGIMLAYKIAEQNFIKDGTNRVILCTDGDFNVGVTSTGDLQRLAEDKAKNTGVFLTVLGFGRGNLNDQMMEAIADHGNGNYHYVDNRTEARKVLVEEMTGTLVTIAKDVKIQIEFNPAQVAGYRLIGYENRVLAAQDFNDDKKDAGEIGAGHTVTALYEIVPAGQKVEAATVDELKYAPIPAPRPAAEAASPESVGGEDAPARYATDGGAASKELLTLKIRYKQPDADTSTKLEFPVSDNGQAFTAASQDFQFASAVAGFGMLLRGSQYKGDASFAGMLEIAESASRDRDPHGYRREFCEMVTRAKELAGY